MAKILHNLNYFTSRILLPTYYQKNYYEQSDRSFVQEENSGKKLHMFLKYV